MHTGCTASIEQGDGDSDTIAPQLRAASGQALPECPESSDFEAMRRWATEVEQLVSARKSALRDELAALHAHVDRFSKQLSPCLGPLEGCVGANKNSDGVEELQNQLDLFMDAMDAADTVMKAIANASAVHATSTDSATRAASASGSVPDQDAGGDVVAAKKKRASIRPSGTHALASVGGSDSRQDESASTVPSPAPVASTSIKTPSDGSAGGARSTPHRPRIASIAEGIEESIADVDTLMKSVLMEDKTRALYDDLGVGRVSFVCQDMIDARNPNGLLYNTEKRSERETERARRHMSMSIVPTGSVMDTVVPNGAAGGRRLSFANHSQTPLYLATA